MSGQEMDTKLSEQTLATKLSEARLEMIDTKPLNQELCYFCGEECQTGPEIFCSFCHEAAFCNDSFTNGGASTVHRPVGLERCLPFRIGYRTDVGRILIASRDIRPGELAILDRAAAVLPENRPMCLGCLVPFKSETFASCVTCPDCNLP